MIKDKPAQSKDLVVRYSRLAKRLEIYKNDPKRNKQNYLWDGFGLIHNRILSVAEILSDYYRKFDVVLKGNQGLSNKIIIKEIFGRITTVTTWCFISIFSAIEFTIKNIIKDSDRKEFSELKKNLINGDRVYLENIIKKIYSFKTCDKSRAS